MHFNVTQVPGILFPLCLFDTVMRRTVWTEDEQNNGRLEKVAY
jgi:hypothetical protein